MKVSQLVQYLAVGDTDSMTSSAYFFCLPFSKKSSFVYNPKGTS